MLLFTLVVALLWFALAKSGAEVKASDSSAGTPGARDLGTLERVATSPHD